METFNQYLSSIEDHGHQKRFIEIFTWIMSKYPQLKPKIAWNQPMFTDHGTFIIGFSMSKNHIAVTPEIDGINHFSEDIIKAGYEHSLMIFRIKWNQLIDYTLLEKMINFNISDKAQCATFWRK